MQFLQHFMFSPLQQQNYIAKLSGGELRRLYLCTVLMQNPNFLVLDEPTNDLDINTLQILEQYLQDFHGCVIVVSHDRYFMDKEVDHLLVFRGDGVVEDFPGNYSQFRAYDDEREACKAKGTSSETSPVGDAQGKSGKKPPRLSDKRRMTFKEKQEFARLEQEIGQLEREKQELEDKLSSGTISVQEITDLSKRLPILNEQLDEKSMRWLELSEIEE